MWKTLAAGTTVLAIAGASLAYAQKAPDGADQPTRWRPNVEDMAAFGDARIAALHAGLKLSADQEKMWPAVETALRDLAKLRADRVAARESADKPNPPTDPIQRLTRRADMMTQSGTAMKKLADAAGPLYKSLDDGQKRRMMILARFEGRDFGGKGPHGHHGWRHHRGSDQGFGRERGFGGRDRGPMGPDGGRQPQ